MENIDLNLNNNTNFPLWTIVPGVAKMVFFRTAIVVFFSIVEQKCCTCTPPPYLPVGIFDKHLLEAI